MPAFVRQERQLAYWSYDPDACAYYFEIGMRRSPTFTEQRRVTAVLDIAEDGTLAGVELVDGDLPLPPRNTIGARNRSPA